MVAETEYLISVNRSMSPLKRVFLPAAEGPDRTISRPRVLLIWPFVVLMPLFRSLLRGVLADEPVGNGLRLDR